MSGGGGGMTTLPACVQRALEHMQHNGELRVYAAIGDLCRSPPKIWSGVIVSDLGRMSVSQLTIKRLRKIGTKRNYRNYKYGRTHEEDTFELWETLEVTP